MDLFDLEYNPESSIFYIGDDEILIWGHPNESLNDHIDKTKLIFNEFIDINTMKNFYKHFQRRGYITITYELFLELLDKMVEFHDSAKVSFNFQLNRLKNENTSKVLKKYGIYESIDLIEINHSYVSSLLYSSYLIDNLDLKNNIIMLLCSYIIYGHHTSVRDILDQEEFVWDSNELSENTFYLFSKYYFNKEPDDIDDLSPHQDAQKTLYKFLIESKDPAISFFYSYLYSLLVISDVIASSMANENLESVKDYSKIWNNRINESVQSSMEQKFYKLGYNKNSRNISQKDLLSEEEIDAITEINELRTESLKESSYNLIKSLKSIEDNKIFYLNMPTGGGKTNTSMKLALDILKNTGINRVIYAMPFINIIEQNYDVIKDNYGLSEDKNEIRKIYSASESIFPYVSDEDKSDIIMKDNFFDYPVIFTTFVSLFNPLIKNKKRYKYSLSSLTNSVVILDEIQSLPLRNWTSLYYLINELSDKYNIYFIIMSATLPEFNKLKINKDVPFDYSNVHLIEDTRKYFLHPIFDRARVQGAIKLLESEKTSEFNTHFESILEENFHKGYTKGLIVLNTIKMSKLVYDMINDLKEEYGFETDLLNSTIIPSEKRKIIYKINNTTDENKYILVSTQSIEAGVDVSFDFVIRDFATLDSIEQVQGRCNRSRELNDKFNDERIKGNVYIIKIKRKNQFDHLYIYDKEEVDTKIKETANTLDNFLNYSYEHVLDYYNAVSRKLNEIHDSKEDNFVIMDRNNLESWNTLKYSQLVDKHGIHIIQNKDNECSFYVSSTIDILINSEWLKNKTIESMNSGELEKSYEKHGDEFIFTLNELKYLKDRYGIRIIKNNIVDGTELINYYKNSIEEVQKDFGAKKLLQKEFSSILYKFIFQVSVNDLDDLIATQDLDKVGYFHIIPEGKIGDGEECIYSMKNGFNFDFMKNEDDLAKIL